MQQNTSLGACKEIILDVKPIFKIEKTEIKLMKDGDLSETNDSCNIEITVSKTSIKGNITGVKAIWLFKDTSDKLLVTYANEDGFTLTKSGNSFKASNLKIPIEKILKNNRNTLIGKSGKIEAQISIENLDSIVLPSTQFSATSNDRPTWDATYQLTRVVTIPSYTYSTDLFPDLKANPPKIGENIALKISHKSLIPSTARFFFFIWENDYNKNDVINNYKMKSTGYSSVQIRKKDSNSNTGSSFIPLSNQVEHNIRLGCESAGKLNYFDGEAASLDKCEFNCMLGFAFSDENTDSFTLLNLYKQLILLDADSLDVNTPKVTVDKYTIKTKDPFPGSYDIYFYVFVKLEILYLNPKFGVSASLYLYKKSGNTFSLDTNGETCNNDDWKLAPAQFTEQKNKLYKAGWRFREKAKATNCYAIVCLSDLINTEYGNPKTFFQFGDLQGAVPVKAAGTGFASDPGSTKYDYIAIPIA